MNNKLLFVGLLSVFAFVFIPSITSAASLSASPNPFTLSNTIINPGQYSTANTQVSGGSGGPYSAQWTWINSNEINNQVVKTFFFHHLFCFFRSLTLFHTKKRNE